MRNRRKLILPGDKGFNDKKNDEYMWNRIRKQAGFPTKRGASIQITGFYIEDRRTNPSTVIFKNCRFPLVVGFKPPLPEPPVPFQYAGEAYAFIKKMNLSEAQEERMRLVAMAPDPGMGQPMPNVLYMDKAALKER